MATAAPAMHLASFASARHLLLQILQQLQQRNVLMIFHLLLLRLRLLLLEPHSAAAVALW
jgi:hypothetical protein